MFEKVNPCHPNKVADRIAGALVDIAYAAEKDPRIAVEVLIGHGECNIIAETSVEIDEKDVINAVRRITGTDGQLPYGACMSGERQTASDKMAGRCTKNKCMCQQLC